METSKRKRGRPKRTEAQLQEPTVNNYSIITDPLLNPYKIYVDDRCYTIVDKDKKSENELVEKSYGYYTSLSGALGKIIKMKVSSGKTYSIQEYIKEYEKLTTEFKEKFKY